MSGKQPFPGHVLLFRFRLPPDADAAVRLDDDQRFRLRGEIANVDRVASRFIDRDFDLFVVFDCVCYPSHCLPSLFLDL